MIKTAIMQPYLFPYIGYWQLISAVDNYIIYDDVNFIKGGWINRNNILLNSQKHLFTFQLNNSSSFKKIRDIEISDSPRNKKLLTCFENSYSKAPYKKEIMPLLEEIINYPNRNLACYSFNHIKKICDYLNKELALNAEEVSV